MKFFRIVVLFGTISVVLSSCKVLFPSLMFKMDDEEKQLRSNVADTVTTFKEFTLESGDRFKLQVSTNEGYDLINIGKLQTDQEQRGSSEYEYTIKQNGHAYLPAIDSVYLKGLSVSAAERLLRGKYKTLFQDPFVILEVTNRRALVFIGGEKGTVVPLENENTSILEVLARAGGITTEGKAYNIKIIRGDLKNPQVCIVDLSTLEGMKSSNLTVRSNDVIYVKPRTRFTSNIFAEIAPVISLLLSGLTIYFISRN